MTRAADYPPCYKSDYKTKSARRRRLTWYCDHRTTQTTWQVIFQWGNARNIQQDEHLLDRTEWTQEEIRTCQMR